MSEPLSPARPDPADLSRASRRGDRLAVGRRWGRQLRGLFLVLSLGSLSGAALLAGMRLADPTSGRPVQLVTFVPAGLPMALVGLALGMAGLRRRTTRFSLAVAALVLTLVHGVWLGPRYLGAVPAARPGCSLRLLTINAETANGAWLADAVRSIGPDVVVFAQTPPDTLHAVTETNPVLSTVVGLYRSDAEDVVLMTGMPVTVAEVGPGGRAGRVRVESPCLGAVDVFGGHPVAPHLGTIWDLDHAELRAYLQGSVGPALAAGGARVVLAGDLNATLDHMQLRRTLDLGLRDAFELVNAGWVPTYPAPGTSTWHGLPIPPVAPIDHVLLSDGLTVTEVQTVNLAGADHLGIVATVAAPAP